jgi:thiol-disulfide isomerase/thioredoxin
MQRVLLISLIVLSINLSAQEVQVMRFSELQKKIVMAEAPLTIFNFWATWCGPCIKELPHFEALADNKQVKVYLVSLDFKEDIDKLRNFVVKKQLKSPVIFLDEKDPNTYMPKVSKDWSGAIPATLFVDQNGRTFFHEKEFTKEELEKTINKYLN